MADDPAAGADDPFRAAVTERLAATALAEATETVERAPISTADVVRLARAGLRPDGVEVIPIGALRLYRALRAERALAHSPSALAAASADDQKRRVGDYDLEILWMKGAVFVVVHCGERPAPTTAELVGADGRIVAVPLDAPVDGVIQTALPAEAPEGDARLAATIALLRDPATAIYLAGSEG